MASVIEQILAQSQAGSANGASFFDAYRAGRSFALKKEQLELQKRQFEQGAIRQQVQDQIALQNANLEIASLEGLRQAGALMIEFAQRPKGYMSPEFLEGMAEINRTAPGAFMNATGQKYMETVNQAFAEQRARAQARQAMGEAQSGGMVQTRRTIDTGTGSVTMESPDADFTPTQLSKLIQEKDKAVANNAPKEVIDAYSRSIAKLGATSGERIEMTPGGGIIITRGDGVGGELTTSQSGNITMQVAKLGTAIDRVTEIIPNVESIFGLLNVAGNVVVDKLMSNIWPDLVVGERVSGKQLYKTMRESLFKGLREGDSQMSNADVDRLMGLFPKESAFVESPANAKIQLQTFRQELGREITEKAKLTGAPVPDKALTSMSPKTLTLMLQNGEITDEQFKIGWDQNINAEQKRAFIKQLQNAKR